MVLVTGEWESVSVKDTRVISGWFCFSSRTTWNDMDMKWPNMAPRTGTWVPPSDVQHNPWPCAMRGKTDPQLQQVLDPWQRSFWGARTALIPTQSFGTRKHSTFVLPPRGSKNVDPEDQIGIHCLHPIHTDVSQSERPLAKKPKPFKSHFLLHKHSLFIM